MRSSARRRRSRARNFFFFVSSCFLSFLSRLCQRMKKQSLTHTTQWFLMDEVSSLVFFHCGDVWLFLYPFGQEQFTFLSSIFFFFAMRTKKKVKGEDEQQGTEQESRQETWGCTLGRQGQRGRGWGRRPGQGLRQQQQQPRKRRG